MSTITEYFNRAPNPSEVLSAVQLDLRNREKEDIVKQLSEKEESVKKGTKYRKWSVTEKLASTLRYFSSIYLGKSKQSISDFKKVY